jgi:hypothetical protein
MARSFNLDRRLRRHRHDPRGLDVPGRRPVAVFLALIVSAATAAITLIVPASALPPPGEPPLPEATFTLLGSYSTGGGESDRGDCGATDIRYADPDGEGRYVAI